MRRNSRSSDCSTRNFSSRELIQKDNLRQLRAELPRPAIDLFPADMQSSPARSAGRVPPNLVDIGQRCVCRTAAASSGIDGTDSVDAADRLIELANAIAGGITIERPKQPKHVVMARASKELLDLGWHVSGRDRSSHPGQDAQVAFPVNEAVQQIFD